MNEQNMISEELDHAGEVSTVTPSLLELDGYRITSETDVPSEEFLFRMFGKPCFPRRDLSAITGVEKCGKTFFTSMLLACCAERHVMELERIRDQPLKVMWYDTEQSRQSTKSILTDRVFKLVHTDATDCTDGISAVSAISAGQKSEIEENYFVFNVRKCSVEERMNYLLTGIETYKPDLVIVDNVCDLLSSINDAEESVKVINQLMEVATAYDCNITVVIHLNRSGDKRNLRGWLGTQILHKAFDVYCCEDISKTDVLSVGQSMTRKYRINDKLYYKVNDAGLPEMAEAPDIQERDDNGRYTSRKSEAYKIKSDVIDMFNQDYIIRHPDDAVRPWEWDLRRLFGDAMNTRAMMSPDDLQRDVMKLSGIRVANYYKKVFLMAIEQRVVKTEMIRGGRIAVIPLST